MSEHRLALADLPRPLRCALSVSAREDEWAQVAELFTAWIILEIADGIVAVKVTQ